MVIEIRGLTSTAAIGFLPVLALISTGCSSFETEPPPKPGSNWSIQDARIFDEFDLYWLGQTYQGLGLTLVDRSTDGDGVHHASFSYGELSFSGGESGSWGSPLEIDIQPYCGFNPDEDLRQKASFDEFDIDNEFSVITIRGVTGHLYRFDSDEAHLYLWTRDSTVSLSISGVDIDIEQAAQDLIPISEDSGATAGPLGPPTSTEC